MPCLAVNPQALVTGLWASRISMERALCPSSDADHQQEVHLYNTNLIQTCINQTGTFYEYHVNNELYVTYLRRLINPFLHFILTKWTRYEIVSWMALGDTFRNTGTNLHTTIFNTNAFQASLKSLWRKWDSFLLGQTLALQATFVLTPCKTKYF